MFSLALFKIRPFTAGNLASLLAGLGRGGMMFVLIIWLQGIYLPIHGYSFERTPLWAGIAMLPLTVGFLIAGPVSGYLSDRFGARPFATGGMVVAAASFGLLELLPVNFVYWQFAGILLLNGIGMGLFASPNRAGIMNSLPPERRGDECDEHGLAAEAVTSGDDDLEGGQSGVGRVGDPAPVGGHLAQRR